MNELTANLDSTDYLLALRAWTALEQLFSCVFAWSGRRNMHNTKLKPVIGRGVYENSEIMCNGGPCILQRNTQRQCSECLRKIENPFIAGDNDHLHPIRPCRSIGLSRCSQGAGRTAGPRTFLAGSLPCRNGSHSVVGFTYRFGSVAPC
jgi:hypothetical protein